MRVLDKDPRPHYADLLYFGNAFTLTCAEGTFGATLRLREGIAASPPVSENVLLHLISAAQQLGFETDCIVLHLSDTLLHLHIRNVTNTDLSHQHKFVLLTSCWLFYMYICD